MLSKDKDVEVCDATMLTGVEKLGQQKSYEP